MITPKVTTYDERDIHILVLLLLLLQQHYVCMHAAASGQQYTLMLQLRHMIDRKLATTIYCTVQQLDTKSLCDSSPVLSDRLTVV